MKRHFIVLLSCLLLIIPYSLAQYEEQCDEIIEAALMDYLDIDDLGDLFDYLDSLSEGEIDELFDEVGIFELEEDCIEGNSDEEDEERNDENATEESQSSNTAITQTTLEIENIPSRLGQNFDVFSKYIGVFGVHVVATSDVSDEKIRHAATILAEYLDNDEDGEADNMLLLEALLENGATLMMFGDEGREFEQFTEFAIDSGLMMQPLFAFETHPEGSRRDEFDATIEEVLHLITTGGYAFAYPEIWGEEIGTEVAGLMDRAIDVGYYNPYANESDIPYPDQISEYIYWSLTSLLGAQDYAGRTGEIAREWRLATPEQMRQNDPDMVALLEAYDFPTILPDGNYSPE
jgi:hypothetical protein